ncbi:MAG: hypothetical protein C4550_00615 [Nitrospiraceae bacterium]|nr:MAG: hypothetical protein C4550_00615 [Nitrospiraceae bacterium]
MTTNKNDNNDYKVNFKGITISKKESNKVGLALIFGFIGAISIYFSFGIENKIAVFLICLTLSGIGYFWIANKIFKNGKKNVNLKSGRF